MRQKLDISDIASKLNVDGIISTALSPNERPRTRGLKLAQKRAKEAKIAMADHPDDKEINRKARLMGLLGRKNSVFT